LVGRDRFLGDLRHPRAWRREQAAWIRRYALFRRSLNATVKDEDPEGVALLRPRPLPWEFEQAATWKPSCS
jgi:hypothetical protein